MLYEKVQSAVNIVVEWSREWKLNLNAGKSEISFFTVAAQEMKFKPEITIGKDTIKATPHPRLLGVHVDCKLSFNEHVKLVTEKAGR